MDARITTNQLTGRVQRLRLTAESFQEERILAMITDGLVNGETLFELTRSGEPRGAFRFNRSQEEGDGP
jgi:hypothetical protein